jgi:hypothetical protein
MKTFKISEKVFFFLHFYKFNFMRIIFFKKITFLFNVYLKKIISLNLKKKILS